MKVFSVILLTWKQLRVWTVLKTLTGSCGGISDVGLTLFFLRLGVFQHSCSVWVRKMLRSSSLCPRCLLWTPRLFLSTDRGSMLMYTTYNITLTLLNLNLACVIASEQYDMKLYLASFIRNNTFPVQLIHHKLVPNPNATVMLGKMVVGDRSKTKIIVAMCNVLTISLPLKRVLQRREPCLQPLMESCYLQFGASRSFFLLCTYLQAINLHIWFGIFLHHISWCNPRRNLCHVRSQTTAVLCVRWMYKPLGVAVAQEVEQVTY